MASLTLAEAAEQARTSKIDIWRAIQEGSLPAQRTSDGGFAIDQTELFRVFESPSAGSRADGPDAAISPGAAAEPDTNATPERTEANEFQPSPPSLRSDGPDAASSPGASAEPETNAKPPLTVANEFEPPSPGGPADGPNAASSPEASTEPEANAKPETTDANEMAAAFAALGAELKQLLKPPAEARAKDDLDQQNLMKETEPPEAKAAPAPEPAADSTKAETAEAETDAPARPPEALTEQRRRPWWRRFARG
jgi:hypothetical protein